ncbi:hypothetical protein [uncultured Phenylobacterium sp.]|uniref:hypothetical protein n=1 Tax=uncultured Phenylobacterium sp. TaxID=349273 RepID=UPI0025E10576|nr:hypothetical protein [uncultured Phenylobacterium sp.]
MRPEGITIQALLWRTFTPAIVVVAIALGAVVYNRLYDTILDGFARKLTTTSALTAALIDPADHDWLIAQARAGAPPDVVEKDPRYLRNVEPMRRIRRELGLTYLYSQVIGGTKGVIYVLDSTQGEDHSPIGTEDELPADTMAGLRAVTARGAIYASPIQYQEQWGLLKTAAAPARGSDGRIVATVGADVNIGVIQVATQNALFASALIGVGSLLACALVTLAIMRGVARPIEALKADALRIAAGDRNPPGRGAAPREVTGLRQALADLATALIARMRTAWGEMLAEDRRRNFAVLAEVLAGEPDMVTLVDTEDLLAVWISPEGTDAAALLQRRAMRALAERIEAEPALAKDWTALAEGTVVVLDRRARTARVLGERPVVLTQTAGGVEVGQRVFSWEAGR